jgi:hypothetical protein
MRANPLIGTLRLVSFAARDEDGRITYPHGRDGVPAAHGTVAGRLGAGGDRAETGLAVLARLRPVVDGAGHGQAGLTAALVAVG